MMLLYKAFRPSAPLTFTETAFCFITSKATDLRSEENFADTADTGTVYFGLRGVCVGDPDTICRGVGIGFDLGFCFLGGEGSRIWTSSVFFPSALSLCASLIFSLPVSRLPQLPKFEVVG